jgi:aminopeptidase YwaD
MFRLFLFVAIMYWLPASGQSVIESFRHHIFYLADDSLEGRQSGSNGEQMAFRYIITELKKNDVGPLNNEGYLQPFSFSSGKELGSKNSLSINGFNFQVNYEYYPLSYSSNDSVSAEAIYVGYGIQSDKLKRNDYTCSTFKKGDVAVINIGLPDTKSKKQSAALSDFSGLKSRINLAEKNGASAVIFVKTKSDDAEPGEELSSKVSVCSIPVIFLKQHVWETLMNKNKLQVDLVTEAINLNKTAHNVAGYIDNSAEKTIVIGAHYDHLGYNEYRNSLHKGAPAIHNGADDNASGVAMVLELAKYLKQSGLKNRNYLIVAFSGEELGLLGSNYFVSDSKINFSNIDYMLNYDMVGRLDENQKTLTVNGVGTSPQFNIVKNIQIDSLTIQTTESGIGPSDHTSFYLKDIPVLHFFSGIHSDYHKPSDDADKINFAGMEIIFKYSIALIDSLNNFQKITFTKTKDNVHNSGTSASSFKVTLGIMPGYGYSGTGVKVDGVSEGKPAQKAGLKKGDIIIQLGNNKTDDMQQYMKALGFFNKGDKTKIKIIRDGNEMTFKVQF